MANFSIQVDDREVQVVVHSLLGRLDNAAPLFKAWVPPRGAHDSQLSGRDSSYWGQLSFVTSRRRRERTRVNQAKRKR
ncbi:MAG: hypothetical protein OHK0012_28320 [Synechococcales cyanobacterium]